MISDLDENEHDEDSELAVEKLGLKDINDLGPPELPQAIEASFGGEATEPQTAALEANYSASSKPMKPH